MSSNITAVIAGVLNAAGLSSLNLSRDEAVDRDTAAMPYAVSREGISTITSPASGMGATRVTELVQIDLMQNRAQGPDDPTLMPRIRRAIDAATPAQLSDSDDPAVIYRLRPQQSVRRYDPKTQVVTESLTVRVTRTA